MSEADLIRLLDQLNRRVGGEPIPTRPTPTPPALAHIPSTPSSPTKPAFTSTADLASYYATRKQQKELEEELRKEVRMAEIREFVEREAKRIDREMREVSLKICEYAETSFEEHRSSLLLRNHLAAAGFKVEIHPGLPTGFKATWENGKKGEGRVVGVNLEYDGLKGMGQACGHNLISITGLGTALTLKSLLTHFSLPGRLVILGTPAEEGGGGKVIMLRDGAYDEMDCCLISHPGGDQRESLEGKEKMDGGCPWDEEVGTSLACTGFEAEFLGRSAHAGAEPWAGINALDAAVQGYSAVAMLRQQVKPDHRIHGIIIPPPEGWSQNAIPEYCKVKYGVRAPDVKQLDVLYKKVVNCFKASAEATGCTMTLIEDPNFHYADMRNNGPLSEAYASIMKETFGQKIVTDKSASMTASTDFGNVCYKLPAISPNFLIPSKPGGGNHTKSFAESAAKPEAHVLAMKVLQGMSIVGAKFLVDDEFAIDVKESFWRWKKRMGEA